MAQDRESYPLHIPGTQLRPPDLRTQEPIRQISPARALRGWGPPTGSGFPALFRPFCDTARDRGLKSHAVRFACISCSVTSFHRLPTHAPPNKPTCFTPAHPPPKHTPATMTRTQWGPPTATYRPSAPLPTRTQQPSCARRIIPHHPRRSTARRTPTPPPPGRRVQRSLPPPSPHSSITHTPSASDEQTTHRIAAPNIVRSTQSEAQQLQRHRW